MSFRHQGVPYAENDVGTVAKSFFNEPGISQETPARLVHQLFLAPTGTKASQSQNGPRTEHSALLSSETSAKFDHCHSSSELHSFTLQYLCIAVTWRSVIVRYAAEHLTGGIAVRLGH